MAAAAAATLVIGVIAWWLWSATRSSPTPPVAVAATATSIPQPLVAEACTKMSTNPWATGVLPRKLAELIGVRVPAGTQLLYGETDESNPYVSEEQMMPFVPFVRVRDFRQGLELARKHEHNFRHTAIIHSRNLDTITRMGREMDVSLFVANGPSQASLGAGGEGYLSFSIATPTGEGVTTPLTFTRQRRSTTVGSMRVV